VSGLHEKDGRCMNAFDRAWGIIKEFRYDRGWNERGLGIAQAGGYDPETDEAYANLSQRIEGPFDFKTENPARRGMIGNNRMFRTDEELMDRVLSILGHEMTHQALSPPHSMELWNQLKIPKEQAARMTEDEREKARRKINRDWERFQEYGAWNATPGITEDEKWDALSLYGIKRRDDE